MGLLVEEREEELIFIWLTDIKRRQNILEIFEHSTTENWFTRFQLWPVYSVIVPWRPGVTEVHWVFVDFEVPASSSIPEKDSANHQPTTENHGSLVQLVAFIGKEQQWIWFIPNLERESELKISGRRLFLLTFKGLPSIKTARCSSIYRYSIFEKTNRVRKGRSYTLHLWFHW